MVDASTTLKCNPTGCGDLPLVTVDAQMKMPDATAQWVRALVFTLVLRAGTAAEVSLWNVEINSVSVFSLSFVSLLTLPLGNHHGNYP